MVISCLVRYLDLFLNYNDKVRFKCMENASRVLKLKNISGDQPPGFLFGRETPFSDSIPLGARFGVVLPLSLPQFNDVSDVPHAFLVWDHGPVGYHCKFKPRLSKFKKLDIPMHLLKS